MQSAEDKILIAKTALLWDQPFFGSLICHLTMVEATNMPFIDTMATDGRKIYWCRKFVDKLTKDEVKFVLAHEVMHVAFEHTVRRQSRDAKLWNVACDAAINGELVETKLGTMPKAGVLIPEYTGLPAEEIYRLLEQNAEKISVSMAGSDPGACGGVLDSAPAHAEAELNEVRAEIQTHVRQAAMQAKASNAGNIPASIKRLIDELTEPKINWRQVLRRFVDESSTRDFSWSRPNRRTLPHGFITPGSIADGVPHIVIAVDTSGSIDNEVLRAFASEINGAMNDGAVDKITVIYADAAVQHVEEFERGDDLDLHPAGGGGTMFSNTFEVIARDHTDAVACIYLTDMYCNDFGEDPGMPVMWGIYGDSREFGTLSQRPPFGECLHIAA